MQGKHVSVLFVGATANDRIMKISFSLRKLGIVTMGIFRGKPLDDLNLYFDFVRHELSYTEIIRIINSVRPTVVHLWAWMIDDLCLCVMKEAKVKVVFDVKDVHFGVTNDGTPESLKQLQLEAIQRSASFILRDGQAIRSSNAGGITLPKHRIFFPDFCWSPELLPKMKNRFEMNRLAIVGTFFDEKVSPGNADHGVAYICESLIDQGFEISIFPTKRKSGQYPMLEALLQSHSRALKLESPLSNKVLLEQLSHFDFGLFLNQGYIFGLPESIPRKAVRLSIAARDFTYLSACVPILSNQASLAHSFFSRRMLALDISQREFFNLPKKLAKVDVSLMHRNINIARKTWLSIDTHLGKLINFYKQ